MGNIVNGYSYTKFIINDSNNENIETITFGHANQKGIVTGYVREYVQKKTLGGAIIQKFKGYRLTFTIYFDEIIKKSNTLKAKKIFEYLNDSDYRVFIMPHEDAPGNQSEIVNATDELTIGMISALDDSPGNNQVVLQFVSKYLVQTLPIYDAGDLGYGLCDGWS